MYGVFAKALPIRLAYGRRALQFKALVHLETPRRRPGVPGVAGGWKRVVNRRNGCSNGLEMMGDFVMGVPLVIIHCGWGFCLT